MQQHACCNMCVLGPVLSCDCYIIVINTYVSLMYELKKMERYLRVNLLEPDPRLMEIEFTGPRSHKGSETLL